MAFSNSFSWRFIWWIRFTITTCLAAAFLNPDEVAQDGLKVTSWRLILPHSQVVNSSNNCMFERWFHSNPGTGTKIKEMQNDLPYQKIVLYFLDLQSFKAVISVSVRFQLVTSFVSAHVHVVGEVSIRSPLCRCSISLKLPISSMMCALHHYNSFHFTIMIGTFPYHFGQKQSYKNVRKRILFFQLKKIFCQCIPSVYRAIIAMPRDVYPQARYGNSSF